MQSTQRTGTPALNGKHFLAGGIVAAGLMAALVVPALRNYFGLTRPAGIVYQVALPMLALWFVALAAAYRFRVEVPR